MAEAAAGFDPAVAAELTGTRAQDVAAMIAERAPTHDGLDLGALLQTATAVLGAAQAAGAARREAGVATQYVVPRWAGRRLEEMTVAALSLWYDELRRPGGGGGITRTELLTIHNIVRMALAIDEVQTQNSGQVLAATQFVVPVAAAKATTLGGPTAAGAGLALGSRLARPDLPGGLAGSFAEGVGRSSMWVTDQELLLSPAGFPIRVTRRVARSDVSGITRKLRTQMLFRFTVDFGDGSSVPFFTRPKESVIALQQALA